MFPAEEMEPIDATEHLNDLNLKQKATLAMAIANQKQYDDLRAEFRKELDALEAKYKQLEVPIFEERCKIVSGEKNLEETALSAEKLAELKDLEGHLPNFWFHVLRNCDTIRSLTGLSDDDMECMSYIKDVVCENIPLSEAEIEVDDDDDECCCCDEGCKCGKKEEEKKEEKEEKEEEKKEEKPKEKHKIHVQKRGFKVTFHFKEGNPYFPERELSKTYHLMQRPMEDEPEFDGIESVQPTWNTGKNLTKKTVTKTVKSKAKGKGKGKKPAVRKVTEEVPCQSFFNFFNPVEMPNPAEMEDEEAADLQEQLQMELEVGQILCEVVIPRAILWYTGVACGDDGFGEEFGDEDDEDEDEDDIPDVDEDEDEDDDDDDDEDEAEKVEEKDKPAIAPNQETPEECKQQ